MGTTCSSRGDRHPGQHDSRDGGRRAEQELVGPVADRDDGSAGTIHRPLGSVDCPRPQSRFRSDRGVRGWTKRGVIAFTETLALELRGDGIRANAIAPGAGAGAPIGRVQQGRAPATGPTLEDVTADALSIQALKYFVDPDDIAALALFLASDRARSISGQTIAIDGFSKAAQ
jgi:NAD(P)-dependent dehydrogenase (short-subunit alcohol dehydrogenase family)